MGAVLSSCIGDPASRITEINGKRYVIEKLLGEGGFSYVYLVSDPQTGKEFALKKTLCQTEEALENAKKELKYLQECQNNEFCLKVFDAEVKKSKKVEESWEVVLLIPFYKKGTFYDVTNHYLKEKKHMGEKEMLTAFLGICKGVQELAKKQLSHNDLKPGNVLVTDDYKPILMDFGSVAQARYMIMSRREALLLQEYADSHCTPSYRAPELYDVASDALIDERTDIWSLGCTLYALAFYQSPFDVEESSSISLAVKNAKFTYPDDAEKYYSKELLELINWMLNKEPQSRPYIEEVIERVETLLARPRQKIEDIIPQ